MREPVTSIRSSALASAAAAGLAGCASCTDVPLATFARCVAAASPACMVAASRVGSAVLRVVGAMVDLVAYGGALIGEESAGADAGAGAAGAGGDGGVADCRLTGGDSGCLGEGSCEGT